MIVFDFMRECILHFLNCVAFLIDLHASSASHQFSVRKSRSITCSLRSVELLGYVKEKVP